MKTYAKVYFDNGNTLNTWINGTPEDVRAYYLGKTFNLGNGPEDSMATCVNVKIESERQATRVKSDANGNPRYVVHFLAFITDQDAIDCARFAGEQRTFASNLKYDRALERARKVGGRKFHNKQYGGGIVFQCYGQSEIDALIDQARAVKL